MSFSMVKGRLTFKEPVTKVFIHSLKYERVDGGKACFYVEDVEENSDTAGSVGVKFLWQAQKFIVTFVNEALTLKVPDPKTLLRKTNRVRRSIKRRPRRPDEPQAYDVTEIVYVPDSPSHESENHVREYVWCQKDINTAERFILVRYIDNLDRSENVHVGGSSCGGQAISNLKIPSQTASSYGPNKDAFDHSVDSSDNSAGGERPAGGLGCILYTCEKLVYVTPVQDQDHDDELYRTRPVSTRLHFDPPVIWFNPLDVDYGMSTSHFQVSERIGNSVETKVLRVTTSGLFSSLVKSFTRSLSDVREVFANKSQRLGNEAISIPDDVVVVDRVSKPSSRMDHVDRDKAHAEHDCSKIILEEDSESDFDDLKDDASLFQSDSRAYPKSLRHRPTSRTNTIQNLQESDDTEGPPSRESFLSSQRSFSASRRVLSSSVQNVELQSSPQKSVYFGGTTTFFRHSAQPSRSCGNQTYEEIHSAVAKLNQEEGDAFAKQRARTQCEGSTSMLQKEYGVRAQDADDTKPDQHLHSNHHRSLESFHASDGRVESEASSRNAVEITQQSTPQMEIASGSEQDRDIGETVQALDVLFYDEVRFAYIQTYDSDLESNEAHVLLVEKCRPEQAVFMNSNQVFQGGHSYVKDMSVAPASSPTTSSPLWPGGGGDGVLFQNSSNALVVETDSTRRNPPILCRARDTELNYHPEYPLESTSSRHLRHGCSECILKASSSQSVEKEDMLRSGKLEKRRCHCGVRHHDRTNLTRSLKAGVCMESCPDILEACYQATGASSLTHPMSQNACHESHQFAVKGKDNSLVSVYEETSRELDFVRSERRKRKDSKPQRSLVCCSDDDQLRDVGKVNIPGVFQKPTSMGKSSLSNKSRFHAQDETNYLFGTNNRSPTP